MADDPRTVFVAESTQVADAVLGLLSSKGITAEVISTPMHTESMPITGMSDAVVPNELQIRVIEESKIAEAKELLDSAVAASAVKSVRDRRANRTGTMTAECEECGKTSEWPATAMGTTENCPHCGAYMDIPDPDENWDDMDFGDSDDGEEETEK